MLVLPQVCCYHFIVMAVYRVVQDNRIFIHVMKHCCLFKIFCLIISYYDSGINRQEKIVSIVLSECILSSWLISKLFLQVN